MQHTLTMDKHLVQPGLTMDKSSVEHGFRVDRPFVMFLLAMVLVFVLLGIALDPGSFVPVNYEIFW